MRTQILIVLLTNLGDTALVGGKEGCGKMLRSWQSQSRSNTPRRFGSEWILDVQSAAVY